MEPEQSTDRQLVPSVVVGSQHDASSGIPAHLTHLTTEFEQARAYARQARSTNTRRAYAADWRSFTSWCESRSLTALPALPETVALYVADKSNALKVSSLTRHLSAISQAHKTAGFPSPARRSEEPLHSVWSGLVRTRSLVKSKVAPTLTEELRHIIGHIDAELTQVEGAGRGGAAPTTPLAPRRAGRELRADQVRRCLILAARRDRALFLIGFAGALRRSELAALQVEDVMVGADGLKLNIRRSKSDQGGAGTVLGIRFGGQPITCPVRAVQGWIKAARLTTGPVFRGVDRHGNVATSPLDPASIARIIKRRVGAAGLDAALYSGHSLRAGFCTQAARAGVAERVIMRHSRHKDVKVLREYIREGGLFLENPTDSLGL